MTTVETVTVDKHPDFRARIVVDEYPSEPYNDGGSPIIHVTYDWRYGYKAKQLTAITSYVLPAAIVDAAARCGGDPDLFERYLRIFHGTRAVKWYGDRDNGGDFVSFDTADWRTAMGLTDEHIAAHPELDFALANMDEYKAYLEGDCYGIVVEKAATWAKLDTAGEATDDTRDEWEEA